MNDNDKKAAQTPHEEPEFAEGCGQVLHDGAHAGGLLDPENCGMLRTGVAVTDHSALTDDERRARIAEIERRYGIKPRAEARGDTSRTPPGRPGR